MRVVAAPLRVVVLGGSARTVTSRWPVPMDASASVDLNGPDLSEVTFTWTCGAGSWCPFKQTVGKYWGRGGALQNN